LNTYLGSYNRYGYGNISNYGRHNSKDEGLGSEVDILKSIFRELYDENLLYQVRPLELAKSLLNSRRLKLSKVIDIFNLKGESFKEIVDYWNGTFASFSVEDFFNEIDAELSLLKDSDDLKYACRSCMAMFYKLSNHRHRDYLDFCYLFENSKVEALRVEYIETCTQYCLTHPEKSEIFIRRCVELSSSHDSLICQYLLNNTLGMLYDGDISNLSEADMRSHLYENPSEQCCWNSILRNYYSYKIILLCRDKPSYCISPNLSKSSYLHLLSLSKTTLMKQLMF
jgi:hypothetical protein